MAGDLEEYAQLGMNIGKGRSTHLRANPAEVEDIFAAGIFLDLIAQDQDVDAGEDWAVRHGALLVIRGWTK
jgi:hypothetical protein